MCRVATFVPSSEALLGGSWVAIGGVISPLIWVISIATHEPPSRGRKVGIWRFWALELMFESGFRVQGFRAHRAYWA